MKRLALKLLGWGIATIVLVPLLGFLYYDLTRFQPRTDEIAGLIADAHPSERYPPAMLRKLQLIEYRENLSMSAARLLLVELRVRKPKQRMWHWHRTSFLWRMLVKLHLSEDEQLAIICSNTFLGRGAYGFEAGARTYFQRPLAQLTEAELATLVVIARWPSRWQQSGSGDRLLKARDGLLARMHSGQNLPL